MMYTYKQNSTIELQKLSVFLSPIFATGGVAYEFFASYPSLIIGVSFGLSFHCVLDFSDCIANYQGNKALDIKKGQTLACLTLNSI